MTPTEGDDEPGLPMQESKKEEEKRKIKHPRKPPTPAPRPKISLVPFYHSSDIKITEDLKQGHFGDVRRGWLSTGGTRVDVAIKSLKTPNSDTLRREAEIIILLHHDNILELLGVVVDTDTHQPVSIIFPFMANGDLLEYLVMRKDRLSLIQLLKFFNRCIFWNGIFGIKKYCSQRLSCKKLFSRRRLSGKSWRFWPIAHDRGRK